MPNKDWYWDRFEATVKQGELDLSDAQTAALIDNEKFTDTQANQYETDWIDQLYGTDERVWETNKGESLGDTAPNKGMYSTDNWQVNDALMTGSGRHNKMMFDPTWGLDLKRDWTGRENLEVGTKEHYKWQTTGEVDWPHYYNDNAYQAAWKEYKKDIKNNQWGNLEDFLTEKGADTFTSKKVDFIKWADTEYQKSEEDDGDWWKDWDNKYVDQFDPEKAEPYTPTYLDVPDLWGQTEFEAILEPITITPPEGLPTLNNIQRTQVKALKV